MKLRSQNRAAQYTNNEMLSLYYAIGGYVSGNSREGAWGTGAIDEISSRLREELPGLRGFSAGNIKLMRQFFEAWHPYFQTDAEKMPDSESVAMAIDFPMEAFTEISFTHHMEILHKTRELDERLFYIRASCWILRNLRRAVTRNELKEKESVA